MPFEYVKVECEYSEAEDNMEEGENPLNIKREVKKEELIEEKYHLEIILKEEVLEGESQEDEEERMLGEEPPYNVVDSYDHGACCLCHKTAEISNDPLKRRMPLMCDICFETLMDKSKSEWIDKKRYLYKGCEVCRTNVGDDSFNFFAHDCMCVNLFWCSSCWISFNKRNDIISHVSKCYIKCKDVSDIEFGNISSDIVTFECCGIIVNNEERNLRTKKCMKTGDRNLKKVFDARRNNIYLCECCGLVFKNSADLCRHLRIHTGDKPYICRICNNGFTQNSHLQSHIRTHTEEKPFVCQYCNKKFTRKSNLKPHIQTHTGEKPFLCQYCNKGFSSPKDMLRHMRTHTGEKPFVCQYCNKGFSDSGYLRCHIRTHTGEKPFICQYCNKGFSRSSHMRTHIRTHTGEKPFVCQYCNMKFAVNCNLQTHILRSHTRVKP